MSMSPFETVVTLLESLNEKQREQIAARVRRQQQTPCERLGHNYRPCGVEVRWVLPPRVRLVCTKCGRRLFA